MPVPTRRTDAVGGWMRELHVIDRSSCTTTTTTAASSSSSSQLGSHTHGTRSVLSRPRHRRHTVQIFYPLSYYCQTSVRGARAFRNPPLVCRYIPVSYIICHTCVSVYMYVRPRVLSNQLATLFIYQLLLLLLTVVKHCVFEYVVTCRCCTNIYIVYCNL